MIRDKEAEKLESRLASRTPRLGRNADQARLENVAPVLGFDAVEHYENAEPFVALYRDSVELVVVQAARGRVESNHER